MLKLDDVSGGGEQPERLAPCRALPGHGSGLRAAAAPVVAGAARLGPEAVKTSSRNSKSDCAGDENSSLTSSPADASLRSAAARH